MWSQIILTSRNWARLVWVHCTYLLSAHNPCHGPPGLYRNPGPDSLSATPPVETEERELDRTKAEIEKATIVRMALAFSVAVKHYLRGEEGMYAVFLWQLTVERLLADCLAFTKICTISSASSPRSTCRPATRAL